MLTVPTPIMPPRARNNFNFLMRNLELVRKEHAQLVRDYRQLAPTLKPFARYILRQKISDMERKLQTAELRVAGGLYHNFGGRSYVNTSYWNRHNTTNPTIPRAKKRGLVKAAKNLFTFKRAKTATTTSSPAPRKPLTVRTR